MKIIPASHLDHGLNSDQVNYLLTLFADRNGFFIATVNLPDDLGTVPCALYGPTMGDEPILHARWAVRPGREYPSRVIAATPRPTRKVTVIAGPHEDAPCVVYTIFGGPPAPKEIHDPTHEPRSEKFVEAFEFWTEHALAVES